MTSTPPVTRNDRDGFVPIPAEFAERYRAAGYWTGQPLGELLRAAAERWPDRPALHEHDRVHSYRELDAQADRMAHGFLAHGIAPGDRVLVQLPNVPAFVAVLFGLLRAGAIPVLALPAHRRAEIEHLAELSGAVACVVADRVGDFDHRELAATVAAAVESVREVFVLGDPGPFTDLTAIAREGDSLPVIESGEIALMLVSGGTTGLPKLIARTHDDYAYNARASAAVCELGPDDVYLATLPAAHNFPLACPGILGTVATGGSLVLAADPSPENAFAVIERHRVTVTAVVPPLAQLWCAATEWEEADLSSLRLLQVGGAKLAEVNAREVEPALGARLQQVFGMAEGLLNYTRLDDGDETVCTTQGRPLSPADEVRVVDAHGDDVPDGAEGELLTRGPYTIRGYYRAPEHNSRAFTPDGFYRSGDLVRRLPSGHLVVSGRIKDVINRGGENISCDELEEHLLAHPAVRHAAAVGLPDPALGERVCAVLVAEDPMPSLADIKRFLTARGLATYKLPDLLRQADHLPLTAVGKIDKKALRADL
ncbi:AMP-binding protein [Nocardia terpenica]|uniref:(2,3-dihydroxybenzoyl)adenylate synthase n=1 Tax=Nocardia terpenica TaxID=455432 RepID=UPI001892FC15|nr:AMP-binding protein [Nocardia terpenica]MBF6062239.1 AMP-binding protein [Nocardia terpenica]MBF6104327.1 AMP-binding protein [Nocardia terpenica]MBF6109817.1 AMP-binding protein [Nocardia terpenica]MBF6120123.1 AMP-binding protein [Nocardia terpenica]MBF6152534.1 AMP-binding protein [Nocardia terpenica]